MSDIETGVERRIVDNRVLILGLDGLYRDSMPELEVTRLLECARTVARALRVAEASVPVEGYYADLPELTEYFRLMRALQDVDQSQEKRVSRLPEFEFLRALVTSGLYGPTEPGFLLPRGRDPLSKALRQTAPSQWTVAHLLPLAHSIAESSADFSLVALAARTNDPVTVAATRESVVLYAGTVLGREAVRIEYAWQVDDQLAAVANQFIATLNQFVPFPIPMATAENAEAFHASCEANDVLGRCAMIGEVPDDPASRYYHWAIAGASRLDMHVHEFWDPELWTSTRYAAERGLTPRPVVRLPPTGEVSGGVPVPRPGEHWLMRLSWGRLLVGLVVAALVPSLILVLLMVAFAPTREGEAQAYVARLVGWVVPVAGAVTTLVGGWWVARGATTLKLRHGIVLGCLTAALDLAVRAGAGDGFGWLFVLSILGRVVAGALGGALAARGASRV